MCVWERPMCVLGRPMCVFGRPMCVFGRHMCVFGGPSRSYILIFPSLFFFQPFFFWVLLMFFQNPFFPPYRNCFIPLGPHQKKSCMESLPLFSLGLAYVFSISPFSSLKKIFIPLGSQKTQHKSPKRTGRQRSHSRIFFFLWDRWDGWIN